MQYIQCMTFDDDRKYENYKKTEHGKQRYSASASGRVRTMFIVNRVK